MRIRNYYGVIGPTASKHAPRTEPGPRKPITSRGRQVLEASRRRTSSQR